MTVVYRHFALVFGIVLVAVVVELVRRRRLREANALTWLFLGLGALLLGMWPALWRSLAARLGGGISPLLALSSLFLLLAGLQLSCDVTVLRRQVRKLAQKNALLEERMGEEKGPPGKGGRED